MARKRKYFDPAKTGGTPNVGYGSSRDPNDPGGTTMEGGSPRPDPKNQKVTSDGRTRYSGNSPNVGGGQSRMRRGQAPFFENTTGNPKSEEESGKKDSSDQESPELPD